jgi:phospholipase C
MGDDPAGAAESGEPAATTGWSRRQALGALAAGAGVVALAGRGVQQAFGRSVGDATSVGTAVPPGTPVPAIPPVMGRASAPVLQGVPTTLTPLPPGTRPDPGRPERTDLIPEIEHVVVLMMENHSFDNYFGMLGRGDGFTLGPDGQPVHENPDADGQPVRAFHMPSTVQTGVHVTQNWVSSHRQYDDGRNDGFVVTSGRNGMGYFTGDDLPFYYSLASQFPLCDRYFGSVLAQTYPNRRFLQAATALGNITTELPKADDPVPPNGTIFDVLDRHGITWRNYTAQLPEIALYPPVYAAHKDSVSKTDQFVADAAAGTLPFFSLVTPHGNVSEENPQDIRRGESFSAAIISAVLASPTWSKTVLVFTYDEHGGYYDHVPPPPAFPPDDVPPDPTRTKGVAGGYDRLGFRVPTVIVSPYARKDYVSHVVHDHTSVLRLIETKWNLGALTYRDANASNLLDTLDLDAPPAFLQPPRLAASSLPPDPLPAPPPEAAAGAPFAQPTSLSHLAGPGVVDLSSGIRA